MSGQAGWPTQPVVRTPSLVWQNLPVLTIGATLAATGWCLPHAIPGQIWPEVVGLVTITMPTLTLLSIGVAIMERGDHFGIGDLVRGLRRAVQTGIRIQLCPVAVLVLLGASRAAARTYGAWWMELSLGANAALCVGLWFLSVPALIVALGGRNSVVDSYRSAVAAVARRPLSVLGVVACLVLLALAGQHAAYPVVILFMLPIPLIWARAGLLHI